MDLLIFIEKNNTSTIVGIPMDKKGSCTRQNQWEKVTKIELMDVFSCSSNYYFRDEFYGEHEDVPIPKVEYLSIPKTVKVINIYAGIGLNGRVLRRMQSFWYI